MKKHQPSNVVALCISAVALICVVGVVKMLIEHTPAPTAEELDLVLYKTSPSLPAVDVQPGGVTPNTKLVSTPAPVRAPAPTHTAADLAEAIAEANAVRDEYRQLLADQSNAAMQLRMEQAEGKYNALDGRLEWYKRELARATLDPSTPFGHFALMPEAADLDSDTLQRAQGYLDEFPVVLAPHEAQWLIDRITTQDWRAWPGDGVEETLITYLRPDRLKAELPQARVAELVACYADDPWVFSE